MSVSIKPLEDRIVIRQVEAEQTTASGLVIPDTAKEKPQEGEVVAVGPGRIDDNGNRVPLDVAVGDRVLYSKYGGTEVKFGADEFLVLSARDVLAVVVAGPPVRRTRCRGIRVLFVYVVALRRITPAERRSPNVDGPGLRTGHQYARRYCRSYAPVVGRQRTAVDGCRALARRRPAKRPDVLLGEVTRDVPSAPEEAAGSLADNPRERALGGIYAFTAYFLWGFLPLYFLLLAPTGPFEIVAWRILLSLAFCAILLTVMRG